MSEFEHAIFEGRADGPAEIPHLISGPAGVLEAVVTRPSASGALSGKGFVALVCHPHPQHGGTMTNKVVTTLVRSYRDLGVAAVRFNFRGVGKSEGEYDEARGEVDDVLAMVTWLRSQAPNLRLLLAGFSFGSAVAAAASHRLTGLEHLTLVAPPVMRYDYDREHRFPCPVCVIQGGEDELFDAKEVFAWAETLESPSSLLRFDEASHFFHGALVALKSAFMAELELQIAK